MLQSLESIPRSFNPGFLWSLLSRNQQLNWIWTRLLNQPGPWGIPQPACEYDSGALGSSCMAAVRQARGGSEEPPKVPHARTSGPGAGLRSSRRAASGGVRSRPPTPPFVTSCQRSSLRRCESRTENRFGSGEAGQPSLFCLTGNRDERRERLRPFQCLSSSLISSSASCLALKPSSHPVCLHLSHY